MEIPETPKDSPTLRIRKPRKDEEKEKEKKAPSLPMVMQDTVPKVPPKPNRFKLLMETVRGHLETIYRFLITKKNLLVEQYKVMNEIDRESSMGKVQETILQVKLKKFWMYYQTNIKFSIFMTLVAMILLYNAGKYLFTYELVVLDNENNVIVNPFIYKLDGNLYLPMKEIQQFKSERKWFEQTEKRNLEEIDFVKGYFPAEVYKKGIMNVPFNQSLLLFEEKCIDDDTCSCAALSQFGINKNIYIMKVDDNSKYLIMYGLTVVQKSERIIKSAVTINGRRNLESPSSFIIEYLNQNGKKVRYTTMSVTQAICIQLFSNIQDLSFYD